ncbi:ribonuclease Z [Candidatus Micrarchaeota archaeon]|nr:ribonuclease Z [Candidatus Micrarchaeota archaeon]
MKIVILGSSGSVPTKDRNLPSIALCLSGEIILFDCGEGTQRQLMKYNLNPSKISKIFLSHLHLDHCLGVYGILETMNLINKDKKVVLFGPLGTKKMFQKYTNADIHEVNSKKIILKEKNYSFSSFKLKHNIPMCLGFVFKENNKIKFYENKAKAKGIIGPLFKEIEKKSKIKINNKLINLSDISYELKGKKIVYVSDTLPLKSTINNSKQADLLIHDSTYLSSLTAEAAKNYHSTAKQAAQIAKTAGVKQLLLFHISQRHKESKDLEYEARKIFKNSNCARDGMIVEI